MLASSATEGLLTNDDIRKTNMLSTDTAAQSMNVLSPGIMLLTFHLPFCPAEGILSSELN